MKLIPIYTWNKGVIKFNKRSDRLSKQPWFQGVLLLICVVAAMLLANLPLCKEAYHEVLETSIQLHVSNDNTDFLFPKGMTVEKFINDILMVVFFFAVGLEIKREIASGELSSPKKALLPVIAAFGGVIAPALIFTLVNHGTLASGGWGIPTATDIAFAVCIMSVLGDKVPISLKVFLTALAIADDLIAILVVALFYGGSINVPLLGISFLVIVATLIMRRIGEKRIAPYIFMAIIVWILFYYSGIHATMSGVVMAFLIPSAPRYTKSQYYRKRAHYFARMEALNDINNDEPFPNGPQKHYLRSLHEVAKGTMDMSYRVEHTLTPWVNFLIMPVFALANAGVTIPGISSFNIFADTIAGSPEYGMVGLGIFLGLVLGKPIGITLFSWLAIKLKVGDMPSKATWPMFFAVACLGGIGFTMSIFVDTLSFGNVTDPQILGTMRDAGKIAVLMGSIFAGVFGSILVNAVHRIKPASDSLSGR